MAVGHGFKWLFCLFVKVVNCGTVFGEGYIANRCGLLVAKSPPTVTLADRYDQGPMEVLCGVIVDSVSESHGRHPRRLSATLASNGKVELVKIMALAMSFGLVELVKIVAHAMWVERSVFGRDLGRSIAERNSVLFF